MSNKKKTLCALFAAVMLSAASVIGYQALSQKTEIKILDRQAYKNLSATWASIKADNGYFETHDVKNAAECFDIAISRSEALSESFTVRCYDERWMLFKFEVRNETRITAEVDLESIRGFSVMPLKKITKRQFLFS